MFIVLGLLFLVVVLFNHKLFAFFTKKRGVIFSVAAVPFQLTYYLVSLAGFLLGSVEYFWEAKVDR
jgi:hypothetical protein